MSDIEQNNENTVKQQVIKLQQRLYEYSIYTNNLKARYKRELNEMKLQILQNKYQIEMMQKTISDKDEEISGLKQSLKVLF